MRNLYCNVEALRKQVFAAVAKLAYEGGGLLLPHGEAAL